MDGLIALAILAVGALLVVWLTAGVGRPFLRNALSYLGSCLVALVPILVVFVAVTLVKGGDKEPDFPPLVYGIAYLAAATLGAGVYYVIHTVVAMPSLVGLSELLGGLVVFGGGWMVLVAMLERRRGG